MRPSDPQTKATRKVMNTISDNAANAAQERWPRKTGQSDKLIPTGRGTGFFGQSYAKALFG